MYHQLTEQTELAQMDDAFVEIIALTDAIFHGQDLRLDTIHTLACLIKSKAEFCQEIIQDSPGTSGDLSSNRSMNQGCFTAPD